MELTPKAQTADLIKQANNILILTHEDPDGDAAGSALALYLTMKKLGKTVEVILSGFVSERLKFLPSFAEAKSEIPMSNDLTITINTERTGEDLKLGWKKMPETHNARIVITPNKGVLKPEDIKVERMRAKYDLVIILDTGTPDKLGKVYEIHQDLFFEVPTIVIDHHATNSYFAKVNWVDLSATATAEILISLIESLSQGTSLFDADISTALLTGLITDTGSFQNINTTSKSLTVAAQMVAVGARQQEIVQKIYKNKTLKTLKLWGRALSQVTEDDSGFLWTTLSKEDFEDFEADPNDLDGLLDELFKTASAANFVLLLTQRGNMVHGGLRAVHKSIDVSEIAGLFGGGGHKPAAAFEVEGTLDSKKNEVISKIRHFLKERKLAVSEEVR